MLNSKGLFQIFKDNNTDKAGHGYHSIYTLLSLLKEPKRILEIGVFTGGSMYSWAEYFSDTEIVGIEVNGDWGGQVECDDRMNVIIADAVNAKVEGNFDWIIDDGSHNGDDVEKCFGKFWKQLNPGGWYIIEDLHCGFPQFAGGQYNGSHKKGWYNWLMGLVANNLHQEGKSANLYPEDISPFGMVFMDRSIIAIQKRV